MRAEPTWVGGATDAGRVSGQGHCKEWKAAVIRQIGAAAAGSCWCFRFACMAVNSSPDPDSAMGPAKWSTLRKRETTQGRSQRSCGLFSCRFPLLPDLILW